MRMVRRMCGVKLSDEVACEELRDRLGLEFFCDSNTVQ